MKQTSAPLFLLLQLVFAVLTSCNLINPAEPVPAYLRIDTMMLTTQLATQGSASHKISDVWVFVDNEPVGTYEMPAKFPVLFSGSHTITVQPGVLLNGINATHLAYPYYKSVIKTADLVPGQETLISDLVTSYKDQLTFSLNEDFEGLIPFSPASGTSVSMVSGNDAVQRFEGGYGLIKVNPGETNFELKSSQLTLPNDGTNIYLEMNYKNSAPFVVALQAEDVLGNSQKNNIIILNTKQTWNKIYIELYPTMAITPNADKFRILLAFSRTDTTTEESFYFDNVKVVHN